MRRQLCTVAALLSAAVLGACRIELGIPPVGGTVSTESGSYSCTAQSCPSITVDDLEFDETFVATPADGYEFAGWAKRERGLCGGKRQPCRLLTAGFSGNDGLLAFLEDDDEIFFLEATFRETGGGGSGSGHASACWNEALLTPGMTVAGAYRTTEGGEVLEYEFDRYVEGGVTFGGTANLRRAVETAVADTLDRGPVNIVSNSYFRAVPSFLRVRAYGSEQEVAPQLVVTPVTPESGYTTVETRFTPFQLQRFDLSAGESFTQRYESRVEQYTSGEERFTQTLEFESRITFLGVESLTVEAGTFQACRFLDESSGTRAGLPLPVTTTSTLWYHVGTGLLLKSEDSEDGATTTSELVRASINGADI